MKNQTNVNWLVLITTCLLIAAFSMFYLSLRDSIGLNQCVYSGEVLKNGDIVPGQDGCVCNSNGKIVCDTSSDVEKAESTDFTSEKLDFQYSFLNNIKDTDSLNQNVDFVDISNSDSNLKIVLERKSFCNSDSIAAPEVGFYKSSENSLILTVATNLVDTSYSIPCITEDVFTISDLRESYSNDFAVYYQDEYDTLTPAQNCVYEGYLRNDGDVYQSLDGCALCSCSQGLNKCELEDSCLQ